MQTFYAFPSTARGIIRISGEDRVAFLQGLVSNDVRLVSPTRTIWAALLTPQGRYLHDFFIGQADEALQIDVALDRMADLTRRLKLYKLRSKIAIDTPGDLRIALAWGQDVYPALQLSHPGATALIGDVQVFADPRYQDLGVRIIGTEAEIETFCKGHGFAEQSYKDWERLRLTLGIPNGNQDLIPDKSLLLESGFDELHGVAWDKGCYMGQELTARTKYRGLIKRRLVPVLIDGPSPASGTLVMQGEEEAGEMRSSLPGLGLALLKLGFVDQVLSAAEARLTVKPPPWMVP